MSTVTQTPNGRVAHPFPRPRRPHPDAMSLAGELALWGRFISTVLSHLLLMRPALLGEYARWQRAALQIPEPRLRRLALSSLQKRGNIEGAALLATLAPRVQRRATLTAQVAFQTLYNHLDALSEQPSEDRCASTHALHEALLLALGWPSAGAEPIHRGRPDGLYIAGLTSVCRSAFKALPSHHLVADHAFAAAARIRDFQSLNLAHCDGGHDALRHWAQRMTPAGTGLQWWETAAAAGSSLPVHALIAAAADPCLCAHEADRVAGAYFPWIGALHSLLDSLVDREEDSAAGRPSLLAPYPTQLAVLTGLSGLACRSLTASATLPRPYTHRVILTAMCSYYLSAPEAQTVEGHAVAASLSSQLGPALRAASVMFAAKRMAHHLGGRPFH